MQKFKEEPMKKTLWSLIALLTVFSLLLAGCNSSKVPTMSAQEILEKSQQEMANISSAQVKLVMDMTASGVQLSLNAEGAVEPPDKAYMKMSIMGQTIETLMLGPTEAYLNTGTGWEPVPASELGSSGMNTNLVTQQSELLNYLKNLAYKSTEQVGGVDCYQLTFDLDLSEALKLAMTQDITGVLGEISGTASGEMWVGTNDFYMRKLVLKMSFELQAQKVDVTMTMEMLNFNQPVTFPSPK
jgi:outer membrane lipoprotein-sorting protein